MTPQVVKSNLIVRKKCYSMICLEKQAALNEARRKLARARYRALWHKAFRKITYEKRKTRQRVYNYWRNAAIQLKKLHYDKKNGQIKDRFAHLCGEFERLMTVDDWRQIRRKEYNLEKMMRTIDNRHREKVMDQFRNALVSHCLIINLSVQY